MQVIFLERPRIAWTGRANKPVAGCDTVEGSGWKSYSHQLVSPALGTEKDLGAYDCQQSTSSFGFPTENTDQDETEWQCPLTVSWLVVSAMICLWGTCIYTHFPLRGTDL